MCGHVGIAGRLEFKDEAVMRKLLLADFFRGPDSTGLAAIRNNGQSIIAKVPSHPLDLFDMGKFKSALSGASSKVFLGHNRAATRGVINHYNTHPFQFAHITGAHNGTLDYKSVRELEDMTGEKFPVDSQSLIHAIAELGVEKAISLCEEGDTSTDGAWALVWYDEMDDSLNFLRNKHRPMWYAFSEDFTRLFWASEYAAIEFATKGVHKLYKNDKGFSFWQMDEDVLYKYELSKLVAGGKTQPKAKAKVIKGKEPKIAAAKAGFHAPLVNRGGTTALVTTPGSLGSGSSGTTTSSRLGSSSNSVHITTSQPFDGLLSVERFDEFCKGECSFCSRPIEYNDPGLVVFEKESAVLCPVCSTSGPDGITKLHVKNAQTIEHLF